MSSVDPNRVRALVRQALEQKFGLRPTDALSLPPSLKASADPPKSLERTRTEAGRERRAGPNPFSVHPSQLAIGEGPADSDCYEEMDRPFQKNCLIEPHRPCYNSGYCRQLGH